MIPQIDAVHFDNAEKRQPLLRAPVTKKLHTGRVILAPGESVGEHSTEGLEEIIVFLKGSGTAFAKGKDDLEVSEGMMIYFPPHTWHDVKASEKEGLEYVYIVTRT